MPRSPRLLLSHSVYHIMTRGNNRNQVFRNTSDYDFYLILIAKYKKEFPFDLYHYCLMPNHIHLLVKTKDAAGFSIFMKKINLAYFQHYKQLYNWTGHFWQGRYKSQSVGKDSYFIQCGKYIELNPLRKSIVQKLEDYVFSSYPYYAFGTTNNLITEDFLYKELGKDPNERQQNYQQLLISDEVQNSYSNNTWGGFKQRKNEYQKHRRLIS